jgi:hypothetical protein
MHFDMTPYVVSALGWLPNPPARNVGRLLLHLPDTPDASNIPRVCWRHPYPALARAPFNSLLLILFRLRRYVVSESECVPSLNPGRDSLPMGCSGSPRLGIGGVLDPFAHFSCHTCGSPFRVFSSDTPSAYGRLLSVPFISLELWCLHYEVYLWDEEDISPCCPCQCHPQPYIIQL